MQSFHPEPQSLHTARARLLTHDSRRLCCLPATHLLSSCQYRPSSNRRNQFPLLLKTFLSPLVILDLYSPSKSPFLFSSPHLLVSVSLPTLSLTLFSSVAEISNGIFGELPRPADVPPVRCGKPPLPRDAVVLTSALPMTSGFSPSVKAKVYVMCLSFIFASNPFICSATRVFLPKIVFL